MSRSTSSALAERAISILPARWVCRPALRPSRRSSVELIPVRAGRALVAALVAATLVCSGCNQKPKTSDQDIVTISDKELITMVEKAQAKKQVLVILDPRSPAKFAQARLPNAINIHLPQIVAGDARLAKAKQIIVYGTGWMDYSSPAAAKRLLALGYVNVFDFRGGLELWHEAGRPIEGENPTAVPTTNVIKQP
jgi:rhodanese-related sulfurtransferase